MSPGSGSGLAPGLSLFCVPFGFRCVPFPKLCVPLSKGCVPLPQVCPESFWYWSDHRVSFGLVTVPGTSYVTSTGVSRVLPAQCRHQSVPLRSPCPCYCIYIEFKYSVSQSELWNFETSVGQRVRVNKVCIRRPSFQRYVTFSTSAVRVLVTPIDSAVSLCVVPVHVTAYITSSSTRWVSQSCETLRQVSAKGWRWRKCVSGVPLSSGASRFPQVRSEYLWPRSTLQ